MSGESLVPPNRIVRTFLPEAIRAVAAGVIETALATFAVLIAVNRFDSGPATKALLLAAPALGLLGSFIVVPLVVRLGLTASRAAATISLVSLSGFVIAAVGAQSEWCFSIGLFLGIGIIAMAIPLQTHYLRLNYPTRHMGRLFSATIFLRAATTMIVSWAFGIYLDRDFDNYPVLLWVMAGAAGISVLCHLVIPSTTLRATAAKRHRFLESVHVSRDDRVFVRLLVAAMVLGLGVLSSNALRVDYLANPRHGLELDVKTISLITGIIPSLTRLGTTFFWGWLFDRMNFFRLRILINCVFIAALLLYFVWPSVSLIMVGGALFGFARGGGEIMFNLWVTKLAPVEHIADYMSVHTFFAGVRNLIAPFLGFFLVQWANIPVMIAVTGVLIFLSISLVHSASRISRRLSDSTVGTEHA